MIEFTWNLRVSFIRAYNDRKIRELKVYPNEIEIY